MLRTKTLTPKIHARAGALVDSLTSCLDFGHERERERACKSSLMH
jgi:hypothetical protein